MTAPNSPPAQESNDYSAPCLSGAALEFATFWHGPLDAIAYSCLASFAHFGADLRIYSYDDNIDAPDGVAVADARRICPDESLLQRYIVGGKPSLATFADMFRYKLIQQTDRCWVDTDILCLKRPDIPNEAIVFGRQPEAFGQALINNAVLKLPREHPVLNELIQRAEAAVDIDQSWGAIGPFLLNELAERHGVDRYARDFFHFYPIEPDRFWKPLLPAYCDSVALAVKEATFLHLWGELIARCAYDKSACPPVGSFLHAAFQRLGTLHRFKRVYGERELAALLAGWIAGDPLPGGTAASR